EHAQPEQQAEHDRELVPAELHVIGRRLAVLAPLALDGLWGGLVGGPARMKQAGQGDVVRDAGPERYPQDGNGARAQHLSLTRRPVCHVPAEEEDRGEGEECEQHLEDDQAREDVTPERRGEAAATAVTRPERPPVRRDRDYRKERGDHESERENAASDD